MLLAEAGKGVSLARARRPPSFESLVQTQDVAREAVLICCCQPGQHWVLCSLVDFLQA